MITLIYLAATLLFFFAFMRLQAERGTLEDSRAWLETRLGAVAWPWFVGERFVL